MRIQTVILFWFFTLSAFAQQRLTVYFDFDQYHLNETAVQQLNSWIADNDHIEVGKIYGFCDWKGTNIYNDSLSLKRVKTVLDYMNANKIKVREGYEIRGFGEDFVQSKNQGENRKVVIVYEVNKQEKAVPVVPAAPTLQQKIKDAKTGDYITLENIHFFNMSPRILPKSKPVLYELLCAMQDNPKLKIDIQGHICCQTEGDINNLSVMRARAIYSYLVANKINRKRLSYQGFGVTKPIHPIPEQNEQQQNENRRVEIMIVEH
ncbi:OmpA family protein [Flavobacterium sp.]|uniref:OmpA family protein n=1 Tax=Flavobacterium sp. TaxID=239 RepID=UPI0039E22D13